MSVQQLLSSVQADFLQCAALVAEAHKPSSGGILLLSEVSRQQITVAAFLNLFIAWERFIEEAFVLFMMGEQTIKGLSPERYVAPQNEENSKLLLKGTLRYFDYGSHDHVKLMAKLLFRDGYPFEPHISSITIDLNDCRTIRNACAHNSVTTRNTLELLAQRIKSVPSPAIRVHELLIGRDNREKSNITVFEKYKQVLETAAELIANG